jgi:hypothetical protein
MENAATLIISIIVLALLIIVIVIIICCGGEENNNNKNNFCDPFTGTAQCCGVPNDQGKSCSWKTNNGTIHGICYEGHCTDNW